MPSFRHIVLGGGVVAGYAAQAFAEEGIAAGDLAILSADDTLPYDRPPLSKDFLAGDSEKEDILINDADFYDDNGIEVILNTRITQVDFDAKTLTAESGDQFAYEKLLIATGSKLRRLDVPGADGDDIYYLRWFDNAQAIRQRYQDADRAVVIGGGFIGMETAAVLADADVEVSWVFPDQRLMEGFFTAEMSDFFEEYYRERDVAILSGVKVKAFRREGGNLIAVLGDSRTVAADMALAGIGVEPALDIFANSRLKIDTGIMVNEYLETNIADVYAAGDVVSYRDVIFNKHRHIEHWDNAVAQGKQAARIMMGRREPFVHVPYFFSDEFDLSWEYWGDSSGAERTITRGKIQDGSFSVWWLKQERLIAAFVMDRPDEERELAQAWIRSKEKVSAQKLGESNTSLKEAATERAAAD